MNSVKTLYTTLRNETRQHIEKEIIVLCIGTDRSTGDSLGPLVGTYLSQSKLKTIQVYGTLDHPVHAINLEKTLHDVKENHPGAFIIAVDACLGKVPSVGKVIVDKGSLKPGSGVHKELPSVGDVSIKGVVNVSGMMEFFVLQNTRLSLVVKMAKEIAEIIHKLDKYATKKHISLQEVAVTK